MARGVRITGIQQIVQFGGQLGAAAGRAPAGARQVTIHHGSLMLTRIRANASGRPGPRAPTGDYRRSWSMRVTGDTFSTVVTLGTNAAQGRRLEFGFQGVDALGRVYDQPPYEHVGPAYDATVPDFQRDLQGLGYATIAVPSGRLGL